MSHRNRRNQVGINGGSPRGSSGGPPVESLESRTLMAATPLDWPFQYPGVVRVGRTLYIAGTDNADQIRIDVVPGATGGGKRDRDKFDVPQPPTPPTPPTPPATRPSVQVVFNDLRVNNEVPRLDAAPLKRVLINGAGGNDNIIIATGLTAAFKPRRFVIRGGSGDDTITGGDRNETILGEGGNDTIDGRLGRDRIDGGDGDDTITGGTGPDRLFGGFGNDTFLNAEPADQRGTGLLSPRDLVRGGLGTDSTRTDPADRISDDVETRDAA